jgi:hypothetical protein
MAPPQLKVGSYNPNAYVPGGASAKVAKAIQTKGFGAIKPVAPTGYAPGFFNGGYLQDPGVGGETTPDTTFQAPTTYVGPTFTNRQNPLGPSRPDINALIAGDWETQDAETKAASRMGALRGDFTDQLRKALVNLGTSDTSKQAIANKYSANAQIGDAEARSQAQAQSDLASRGILSSGQATKTIGDIAAGAEQSRYDALQQFLSSGETGLRGLGDAQSELDSAIATARGNAANRAAGYDTNWLNYQDAIDQANGASQGGTTIDESAVVQQPKTTPLPPKPVPKPVETAAQRALRLRSEALNRRYGL